MNPEKTWQVLDPTAGSLPGGIESALGDGDSLSACVVILVDSEIDRDWGVQASLAVAKGWAASGRRVILADACLDAPMLHEAAGVENGEGVSDMVLYGASAQRITAHVEGGLMLAPAGTPIIQVADVLEHVKWDMVIRGCREAGATLVFHVSTGTPGAEAMTKRAEGVLVLAQPWKDVEGLLGSESGPLMAVLGPANGDAPSVESDDEEGDVAAVDVLPAPPAAEDDDALAVEALPGLPEDEPPADSATDDSPETSPAFGVADLEGSQYGSEDSPEVAPEGGEAQPSPPDEIEMVGPPEEESTASVDDINYGALDLGVADTADSGSDAPVALGEPDPASGAPTELDTEDSPAEVGVEESLAEVGVEGSLAEVGVEGSLAEVGVEDSPAEVGVEDSPAAVGVEDSPAEVGVEASRDAVGVEALPTEEAKRAAEAKGKPRRGQRGLARLKWQKRRDALVRLLMIVTVTLGVVGGLATASYYGLVTVPGLTLPERARSYVPPPEALPGPTPRSAIMTHVLFYDSWRTMADALAIADALRSRLPNLLFFVTPLNVDGTPQFELYVGPAYSAVEATALREPVAVASDRENPDDWSVKEAPYAFYFGEYESAVNAQGRIEALARASIPAYSLQVAYADGRTRVRVYGGAFWDEFQAEEMGRMISDADDVGEMVLTARQGTVPE